MTKRTHIQTHLPHKHLIRAFVVVCASLSAAGAATQTLDSCRQVADASQRLACYDSIVTAVDVAPPHTRVPAAPVAPSSAVSEAGALSPQAPASAPPPAASPTATVATRPPELSAEDDIDAFGGELVDAKRGPKQLESRIMGEFEGWTGNTVFRLENGQVWVQAESGTRRYRGPANPKVLILRKAFGSYRLKLEGLNKTLRVKRLE